MCILLALILGACAGTPDAPALPDYSKLPPRQLLAAWLEEEQHPDTLRFRFNSEVDVEADKTEGLQGVCGYRRCGGLRMQLLGPLGITLLDYLEVSGESRLMVNKITDEGDDEARTGLLQLLQALSLALTGICQPVDTFELGHFDDRAADFSLRRPQGPALGFTLDRQRGRLIRQTVSDEGLPGFTIDYSDYGEVDGRWMPGRLDIHTADSPTSIRLTVDRWTLGKPFPDDFFDAD